MSCNGVANGSSGLQVMFAGILRYMQMICKIELSKKVGWPLPTAFAFVYLRILCSNS